MCKQALQEYCFPSGMTHEVQLIKTRPSKRYMTYQINAGHPNTFRHSGIDSFTHCSWQRWFESVLWTSSGLNFHDNGPLTRKMIATFQVFLLG
jgi:hypothetical protein